MNVLRKTIMLCMISALLLSGCNFDYRQIITTQKQNEAPLIKAEIHFSDTDKVVGYIKNLGVEDTGKVYVGGASLNYLYDQDGNVVGSYNYQRVEYIKILPE